MSRMVNWASLLYRLGQVEKQIAEEKDTFCSVLSMSTQDRKRADVARVKQDRISDLPRHILARIVELLSAKDGARTNVLSRKWRFIWSMVPSLLFNDHFFDSLAVQTPAFFKQTVDEILLLRLGDILKFDLEIPEARSTSYADIDRWMLYVTRNGVKELSLFMPGDPSTYKLHSSVFNCPTLTSLCLCNGVFKPPNSFLCFPNLETFNLEGVTIMPTTNTECCVIEAPRLVFLDLLHCDGTQYLNIYDKVVDNLIHDERSTLEKLLFSLAPAIEEFHLDSFFLEMRFLRCVLSRSTACGVYHYLWTLTNSVQLLALYSYLRVSPI
ncbi:PREDICTED: F-box/FBD/LRR-repeat protein At1g13570-like [Nicotiana attenuata]|uniref:F-box/FBD/LRR-repeat protein At1g13570-like n=1 Tax=Nicotiana attenuata TaxID=49451 RepID=UPI0009054EFF|nr:PREDICTED: F-box/FBD/LRR-repeat protein At1g13570-like [Nicotiana attenuata]